MGFVSGLRRLGDQLAVKDWRCLVGRSATPRLGRRAAKDLLGTEGAQFGQRGLIRSLNPNRMSELESDRLGRHRIVRIDSVLAQRPRGEHAVTRTARLDDCLLEQAARYRRSQKAVDRDTACGESKDSNVVWIASERGNVLLHPLEGGNLVHVGVVALRLIRMFLAKRREGEESETPDAVIGSDQDDALFSELSPRGYGHGARAAHEPAPVDPDHYGQLRP